MTKVDVISGFLGAGKTTLIKKLLEEALKGEQVVLIENEFGEIGIDGGFLKDAGVQITEMSQGCICCSLVGDFGKALNEVITTYHPDRVIIEPSGVGKLSDVMAAVKRVSDECALELNSATTVADASKAKIYMKNFGEFYNDQIENAGAIVLSRTQNVSEEKLDAALELLREKNAKARILTTPWDDLDGKKILDAMEGAQDLTLELMEAAHAAYEAEEHDEDEDEHEHHHHHHDDDDHEEHEHHDHDDDDDHEEHEHHHHDHDDDDDHEEHEHHHHDHDDDDDHEEHEHHHHDHDDDDDHEEHEHHHHDHHHHHHHHHDGDHDADEIFTSWGKESPKKFDKDALLAALKTLSESEEYGIILRAKGIVPLTDGTWGYFDLVPGEYEIRSGAADYTGRLCVIGSELKEDRLAELFGF